MTGTLQKVAMVFSCVPSGLVSFESSTRSHSSLVLHRKSCWNWANYWWHVSSTRLWKNWWTCWLVVFLWGDLIFEWVAFAKIPSLGEFSSGFLEPKMAKTGWQIWCALLFFPQKSFLRRFPVLKATEDMDSLAGSPAEFCQRRCFCSPFFGERKPMWWETFNPCSDGNLRGPPKEIRP